MLGGEFNGRLCLIPRVKLTTTESDLPYILNRQQDTIRWCFAITIDKSQVQSLQNAAVDLRTSAFTHGQLYAALRPRRGLQYYLREVRMEKQKFGVSRSTPPTTSSLR